MDRSRIRFRFEQRRGHYLVAEGSDERPLTRKNCDAFQLRMLTVCDIPGLLKLEMEELDGRLALRYALNGVKMLTQTMRTCRWTMTAYMNAVCRLAEVLEDCRLYVLDADCLLLEDDRIFIGEAGEFDLRFVYLPFPLHERKLADNLELLMIRWMMYVAEPDGRVIQQLLRLITSPAFKPSDLSRFARQYGAQEAAKNPLKAPPTASSTAPPITPSTASSTAPSTASSKTPPIVSSEAGGASVDAIPVPIIRNQPRDEAVSAAVNESGVAPDVSGWRWFQPSPADAQGMSALLGDDPEAGGVVPQSPPPVPADRGRERVWVLCAAAALTAFGWRFGYASMPNSSGLIISAAATLAIAVGTVWLLIRRTRHHARIHAGGTEAAPGDQMNQVRRADHQPANRQVHSIYHLPESGSVRIYDQQPAKRQAEDEDGLAMNRAEQPIRPVAAGLRDLAERRQGFGAPAEQAAAFASQETERTQYLEPASRQQDAAVYYLVWESDPHAASIPLQGTSLVIGRSREAAGHLDVTPGISRAHLELLHTEEGWTATDLGSRNGTRLNGAEMAAYEPYVLQPDDSLDLAGSVYRFKYGKLQRQAS